MTANGLKMKEIKSRVEFIEKVNTIQEMVAKVKFSEETFAVFYLAHKVLIGNFRNGEFIFYNKEDFDDEFVIKARIFNKDKELYIWRSDGGLRARLRIDNEGENTIAVDARQVLFGTKATPLGNGYTKLIEERGTELVVPFDDLKIDERKNRLFLHTRNYVDFNEAHQAGYVDCRFIGFAPEGRE